MRILITGAAGFIGKNLAESFSKTDNVFCPARNEIDVRDAVLIGRYIKKNRIDTIIHAAVASGDHSFIDNVRMHVNILTLARHVDKVLYFGSGAEYSKTRNLNKVNETEFGKVIPSDQYGMAKYICNSLNSNQRNIINLRLFGVYGKYEDYLYTFISNSIVKNLFGLPIHINQNVIFDYLYVDDLVSIVRSFLTIMPKYQSYNITPSQSVSLFRIAEIINAVSKNKVIVTTGHAGYNRRYTGDNTNLLREMGPIKFTKMEDGIKKLYAYYSLIKGSLNKKELLKDDYIHTLHYRKI